MSSGEMKIGAVIYPAGEGGHADIILDAVASRLLSDGRKLAGAVQRNTHDGDRCRCEMTLQDLASGTLVQISEDRGAEAKGCRLDTSALEEIVGLVCASLESGAELLIVNKFGKREAEGHGFRQAIEGACTAATPVLMMVSSENKPACREYVEAAYIELPLDEEAVIAWCRDVMDAHRPASEPGRLSPAGHRVDYRQPDNVQS